MAENLQENQPTQNPTDTNGGGTVGANQTQPQSFDELLKLPGMQAEFDRRIGKGIETARAKFTDPAVEKLQAQLDGYIRKDSVTKAGVQPAFVDFVTFAAGQRGGDFGTNLAAYLQENPQYLTSAEPAKPGSWGQPSSGAPDQSADGVEAAFRRNNPDLKI